MYIHQSNYLRKLNFTCKLRTVLYLFLNKKNRFLGIKNLISNIFSASVKKATNLIKCLKKNIKNKNIPISWNKNPENTIKIIENRKDKTKVTENIQKLFLSFARKAPYFVHSPHPLFVACHIKKSLMNEKDKNELKKSFG